MKLANMFRLDYALAVLLGVPLILLLVGNLLGSESLRMVAAYSMVPVILLMVAAFIVNFTTSPRYNPSRPVDREQLEKALQLISGAENLVITATRADGQRCLIRGRAEGFLLEVSDKREEFSRDEILEKLVGSATDLRIERREN